MDNKKWYGVQDALAVIQGDDSEFEGCEGSSDEDHEDPDYTPSNKDMENDESSESGDSDCSESGDLDEVPQPKMNPGQQNTTAQEKVFLEKETFWSPWVHIQRTECHTPRQSSYSPGVFQEVHHSRNAWVPEGANKFVQCTKICTSQPC